MYIFGGGKMGLTGSDPRGTQPHLKILFYVNPQLKYLLRLIFMAFAHKNERWVPGMQDLYRRVFYLITKGVVEMRFQLVSDVHLEFQYTFPEIPRCADYLILAGDIGFPTMPNFRGFMSYCVKTFERVFFIPGNHEYYTPDKTKTEVDQILENLTEELGFINLQSRTYTLPNGLTLAGATLWPETREGTYRILQNTMNDYKYIQKTGDMLITPKDTGEWHRRDVEFLEGVLKIPGKKIIVTHHLPSYQMIHPRYKDHPGNCGYASHLDGLFREGVVAWCAGHTHEHRVGKIHGIPYFVNPVGYPGENQYVRYNFTFDL
jgi:predicted phosphodiesterase